MNKREEGGGPLIMIINGMHMLREDEEGRDLLELLQQRAEAWAASGLVTMVFNSDDYWYATCQCKVQFLLTGVLGFTSG
jgi:hypothetical protein